MTTADLYNGFSDEQLNHAERQLTAWIENTLGGITPSSLVRVQALTDRNDYSDVTKDEKEMLHVALTYTAKHFALELIKKEMFRRIMEDGDDGEGGRPVYIDNPPVLDPLGV